MPTQNKYDSEIVNDRDSEDEQSLKENSYEKRKKDHDLPYLDNLLGCKRKTVRQKHLEVPGKIKGIKPLRYWKRR